MSKEAMKLALEALEYIYEGANKQGPHTGISWRCVSNKAEPAITSLREALAEQALDKMAENARELGLDYEPSAGTQVSKVWWDGEKLMAKPIPLDAFYEPTQQEPVAKHYVDGGHLVYPAAQRKPLTDEEIENIANSNLCIYSFARAIEAAHGIKGEA